MQNYSTLLVYLILFLITVRCMHLLYARTVIRNERKSHFRQLKTIDHDLLFADICKINFNLDSKNVDSIVDNYNTVFTSLLDKHAPLKTDYIVHRDTQSWMTEEIMSARREKRKGERVWRKYRLEVHLQMFIAQ